MTVEIPEFELPAVGEGIYLDRLAVGNFRSCYESVLSFKSDATLLVGENNAGKSNLVDALRLVTRQACGRRSRYYESTDIAWL